MSGPGLARSVERNLNRAGLGARVAGAHLASPRPDGGNADAGLVPGGVPRGTVAFVMAPQSQSCVGWVYDTGTRVVGLAICRAARDEAFLGWSAIDHMVPLRR